MRNIRQSDLDILSHILRYCNNIEQLKQRFGEDVEVFKTDIAYRDSVCMNILQIGELAGKLSEEYRSKTKDKLPWSAMRSMRNFFAHNYGNMDLNVIWATATVNIPQVKKFCESETAGLNMVTPESEIESI